MIFGKQRFDFNQLDDEQFEFKMNKFIKYIWQLIISTSNDALELHSLDPWLNRQHEHYAGATSLEMKFLNQSIRASNFLGQTSSF